MVFFMRMAVPESAEKVPFPQIDFEAINDESGKAIRDVIPRWNVSSAELEKFINGDYQSDLPFKGDGITPGEMQQFVAYMQNAWKYVTPAEERGSTGSVFETADGKLRRRQVIYEYTSNYEALMEFVRENPYHQLAQKVYPNASCPDSKWMAVRESSYWLAYSVRKSLSEKFILNLLSKLRHLLPKPELAIEVPTEIDSATETSVESEIDTPAESEAETPTESGVETPTESEAEASADAEVELAQALDELELDSEWVTDAESESEAPVQPETEPEPEDYAPFADREEALATLLLALRVILYDHHCRGTEIYYMDQTDDEYSAPGNVDWASHWSMLYQYLRKDIENNGPVPPELQFFYGEIELGSRLERLTAQDIRVMCHMQDERARRLFPAINQAREHFGTRYEMW